ncbi:hypothetical protein AB1Y20_020851 [Prymnesium parvum]|uniref:aldehyde dehydrogenase (NAD(+)) n=1 Tax=Prymnesium parvum TaxID=97485 RepID=A0AB34JZD5_PRYPA
MALRARLSRLARPPSPPAPPSLPRRASSIAVLSPRDGLPFAEIPDTTAAQVDSAVAAAAACVASGWARREAVDERAAALRRLAASLLERREELATLESRDCGRPLAETRADVSFSAAVCEYYAELAQVKLAAAPLPLRDEPHFGARLVPHAAGVAACITPWNYPLMQAVAKLAPALAAGCAVLLKPSPLASLTCLRLAELAPLPPGALAVLTGGPPCGGGGGAARLVGHPRVDLLSFTGSGAAGRQLLHGSADALRRSALELGGKGALLVFDDADVPAAVDWAMVGIFCAAGQICSATSRVLVHRSIYKRFTDALVAATAELRVGDPLAESCQVGAVISARQQEMVLRAINGAVADGGKLLAGSGEKLIIEGLEGGYYVKPTILADLPRDSAAWREEIFGPVVAVSSFETEQEAIAIANDSPYGLGHAVMSADEERCRRVADELEAGVVWINSNQALFPATPFGGWKQSGFGKEYGEAGLEEYLRYKTVISAQHGFSWNYFDSGKAGG